MLNISRAAFQGQAEKQKDLFIYLYGFFFLEILKSLSSCDSVLSNSSPSLEEERSACLDETFIELVLHDLILKA